jgi:phage baseplate assembly protein V
MINLIKKVCNPLAEKINNIVSKCSINKTNDKTKTQTMQIELYTDEVREKVEHWQSYGFSSHVPKESEGICLFLGGERDQGIVIATEDKDSRITNLEEGEACIYTKEKDKIHLKKGNIIEIETKNIQINTDKFSVKNENYELIEIISQVIELLGKTTTNTMMGPMPLNDFSKFIELKTKIDTFKEEI